MLLQRSTIKVSHALLRSPNKQSPLVVLRFLHKHPLLHHAVQAGHKVWCHSHSTEHDSQPIAFLISKQAVPYQTRGDTCCPGVSTSKTRSLVDSSTICHNGINHLYHSNHYSNHNIDHHHGQLTSRRMEDQISQQ
jgi:hypothetical protein